MVTQAWETAPTGIEESMQDQGTDQIIIPTCRGWTNSTEVLTAQEATFARLWLPFNFPFTAVSFIVNTLGTDDAIDVGLYLPNGPDLTRVVSSGPVTGVLNSAGRKVIPLIGTVFANTVYYLGIVMTASITPAVVVSANFGSTRGGELFGQGVGTSVALDKPGTFPLPAAILTPSLLPTEPAVMNLVE